LPSLLQRRRSPDANQTLHDVWPSPRLVTTFSGALESCPWHFMSKSCVLLYWQRYCTPRQQRASAQFWGVVQRNGIAELSQRFTVSSLRNLTGIRHLNRFRVLSIASRLIITLSSKKRNLFDARKSKHLGLSIHNRAATARLQPVAGLIIGVNPAGDTGDVSPRKLDCGGR